jgi:hypothetical protein
MSIRVASRLGASPECLTHSIGAIAWQREWFDTRLRSEHIDNRPRLDVMASLTSHSGPVVARHPDIIHHGGGGDDDNAACHAP